MNTIFVESSRERLLFTLKNNIRMSILELADSLGITPVAVRHHLSSLLAEGMVEVREERHGVGRPRLVYQLSGIALDRNPSMYFKFTNLLLQELNENLSPEMLHKLLSGVASSMVSEWKKQLDVLPFPQRLHRFVQFLKEEGFTAQVKSEVSGQYDLTEMSCPYSKISLHHPEVCDFDTFIISKALDAEVKRTTSIQSGSDSCRFLITRAN
jgi:DeoR family suf operon transcriptional repressor